MDKDLLMMIVKVLGFLPFILGLIYLSLRYGGSKLQNVQNGKFVKIIERVPVTKDNTLIVTQIGSKGYVIASSAGKMEILMELEETELMKLQEIQRIPQFSSLSDFYKNFKVKRKIYDDEKL